MTEANTSDRSNRPRITHIPKHIAKALSKVQPVDHSLAPSTSQNASTHHTESFTSIPSQSISSYAQTSPSLSKLDRSSTSDLLQSVPTAEDKKTDKTCTDRFKSLTPGKLLALKIVVVVVVVLLAATAVVVPVVLVFGLNHNSPQSSFTNMTASSCVLTTCIGKETPYRTSMVTVVYPFDGNTNDLSGYATGTAFGTPVPSVTNQGYSDQALIVSVYNQQYVQIPYVNLTQQSFTLQLWVFPSYNTSSTEIGIFGQCDSSSICFALSLRNARLAVSFDSMNNNSSPLIGSTLITTGAWTHLAFVYDAALRQQQIYVNGRIDAVSYGLVSPYQGGTSGAIATIGRSASATSTWSYYTGRIDNVVVSAGSARSACQVFNDATLIGYFPFDTVGTVNDHSAALSNGIAGGTTIVSAGRIGQALSFPLTTSYFQAACFSTLRTYSPAFTVALWINPSVTTNGGSLVHVSLGSNGASNCYDLLVFTPGGAVVMQYLTSIPSIIAVQGPLIPVNTWTHVAAVFGRVNGLRLYVNGQLVGASTTTSTINYDAIMQQLYVTLGNISPLGPSTPTLCLNGSIQIAPGSYAGMIDDFRLYNREIDTQELCVLVNP